MTRKTTAFRLSDEERAFLERHGRPIAEQLRRDLALVRQLEGALQLGVLDHVELGKMLKVLGAEAPKA